MFFLKRKLNRGEVRDAVLAVTYDCNGRCKFCNIWKSPESFSLDSQAYQRLPQTLQSVNISGGEPFLREDLPEVVRVISKTSPQAKIIISTNGLSPSLIKKQIEKIVKYRRNIGIAVSLDGIGRIHDELRGFAGAYGLVLETVRILKELGIGDLKIAFTLNDKNINQLKRVYRLSKELGVEFSLAMVHDSPHFFQKSNNQMAYVNEAKAELEWLTGEELKSFSPKRWLRAYFTYGLIKLLEENRRILPDYSGVNSLFIDPFGNIFPSNVWSLKLSRLEEVDDWRNRHFEKSLNKFGPAPVSWMVCTAREAIKRNWLKVLLWIFKNKIKVSISIFVSLFDSEKDKKAWQKN